MQMFDIGQFVTSHFVFAVVSFATAVALLLFGRPVVAVRPPYPKLLAALALVAVNAFSALATAQLLGPSWALGISLSLGLMLPLIANRMLKGLSFAGRVLMSAHANVTVAGLLWGLVVIANADVGPLTRSLISITFALAALTVVVGLIQSFEQWEVICRRKWHRPRIPEPAKTRPHFPKVSLHVPTYAEPPELVIATLNSLAKLQYPNFEVLVIDNNTSDPALWKPVEAHCRKLGARFRFFHVDKLSGAKAGALNFVRRHTAPDAELIGVIDADYKVKPNFLAALVDYFDDPQMGFVQTPQAYRDWQDDAYLRMCNWEYNLVFATTLVSRNERMAAITVGTMGLIRRSVLDQVGGWAEWCVTEDSELAVRIHAQGYRSLYLNAVFGRGLIPESFEDYKKQRFRWTYGPIQELRRHFRLFLPKVIARPSALTAAQKLHHIIHGLGALKAGVEFLVVPLGILTVGSMIQHGETIAVSPYIWPALVTSAIAAFVLKWHLFRTTLACSFKDMLGAMMATMALDYIIKLASLWGVATRNTPWRRTNKFKALPLGLSALGTVLNETLLGCALIAAGVGIVAVDQLPDLVRLLAIGCLAQGAQFLTAPMMAVLAEHGIRRRARVSSEHNVEHTDILPTPPPDK